MGNFSIRLHPNKFLSSRGLSVTLDLLRRHESWKMTSDIVTVQLFWVGENKEINCNVSDKKTDNMNIKWSNNVIELVFCKRSICFP